MNDPNTIFREAGGLCARGDFTGAIALYRRLLAQHPDNPNVLSALGLAELARGNTGEGVVILRQSLVISDRQPGAWCNLARGLRQLNRCDEALVAVDRALALAPGLFEAWIARGNILWELDRIEDALAAYTQAVAANPGDARGHFNVANALHRLKRLDDAVAAFNRTVSLAPGYIEAYANMSKALVELDRPLEALGSVDRALSIHPDYALAWLIRGRILSELDRLEEGVEACERAVALEPDNPEAYRGRGAIREKQHRYDLALADQVKVLALKPDDIEAMMARCNALGGLARFDEALAGYDRILAMIPDHAPAHWNKALIVLAAGDFERGWPDYEWRWRSDLAGQILENTRPRWTGEDIAGKTILVWPEQGFGDFVQFCRYVPLLGERGANVVLEVPPRLLPLIRTLKSGAVLIASKEPRPEFDLQCPILSLPHVFETTLDTIPSGGPYLSADPDKVASFMAGLGPRIGIAWTGNVAHGDDRQRSMMLEHLAPLLRQPLSFHSLQKDYRPGDEAAMAPWRIHQHSDEQNDFSDAAALIEAMDLVITVDTVIAHIAGALGKPVWLMLPHVGDWRWLRDRDDSPWYPTMRLFRQPSPGDWPAVVDAVCKALEARWPA